MLTRLVALVLLVGLLSIGSRPVFAVDPLVISSLQCETTGRYGYYCSASVSGGAGGNTYTWETLYSGYTVTRVTSTPSMSGTCNAGTSPRVRLTVTDSAGTTAIATSNTFFCTGSLK